MPSTIAMNNFQPHSILAILGGAIVLALIWLLVQPSRLWYNARFTVPLLVGLGVISVGAIFKIEHWPFADEQLLAGGALAVATYGLWFRAKKVKTVLSCFKLAFVLSIGISIVTLVFWPSWVKQVATINRIFFWVLVLLFTYQRWVQRPQQLPD